VKVSLAPLAALALLAGCTGTSTSAKQIIVDIESPLASVTIPPAAEAGFKDGLLVASIKAKLAADDFDSATRVHVSVHNGVVTLTGAARSAAQRAKDAALTAQVKGVTRVDNQLAVSASPEAKDAGDVALAARITGALVAQTGINALSVHVSVRDGVVTLDGHVPSAAIKATMVAAAEKTSGVRNVDDRIAVRE
jgi:osmotically-inducible protein OsmY